MELNNINIDTELLSYESCVTLFPFFSVNNLEFNYLYVALILQVEPSAMINIFLLQNYQK